MALVLFDLNGTLLDPSAQLPQLRGAIRLAMAHTLAGDFRPFADLLRAAGGEVPEAMPAFGDVAPGLAHLRDAGHELAVVTNSARETGERHLTAAGLLDHFTRVVGTDEVGAYKPSRKVYNYALAQLDGTADDTWLVAAHDWDLIGAHAAGLRTAFVNRGGPAPSTVAPDRVVTAITELAL
jgi:2-haloacid dehalogenase